MSTRKSGAGRQQGFSLAEVLMAGALFSLGSLALLSLFVVTIQSVSVSASLTLATDLAQETIERISMGPYEEAVAENYPEEQFGEIEGYPEFSRAVEIEQDLPAPGMKTITVTAGWIGKQDGKLQTVRLTTCITERVSY